MPHLFVDISSHGFGHLAQMAPILNALAEHRPDLRLTVRSGLKPELLKTRIQCGFSAIQATSDFGFEMLDALTLNLPASAERYRQMHANWPQRVAQEADWLAELAPDLVLTDVAYLPLAGAARLGVPSLTLCSLNWAGLFWHFFQYESWAVSIYSEILSAYRSARHFLRTTPGMAMAELDNVRDIGPIAAPAHLSRAEVAARLGLATDKRWCIVTLGGFDYPLSTANWPHRADVCWLQADILAGTPVSFNDLLVNADAIITKPGYGTFTEASVHGVPVLYLPRHDWPEQPCLVEWLQKNNRSASISVDMAETGALLPILDQLWRAPAPPRPIATGIGDAVDSITALL